MRTALLLFATSLLAACSAAETVIDPKSPDVSAEKASVTKVSPAGIEWLVELSATNPNEMDLEAKSVKAKVVLDGTYDMGSAEIPQEVDLPSHHEIRVGVPLVVDWSDVSMVAKLIALERSVPYDIDGTVKIGVDLFKVEVPFHVSDVITEEQLRKAATP